MILLNENKKGRKSKKRDKYGWSSLIDNTVTIFF